MTPLLGTRQRMDSTPDPRVKFKSIHLVNYASGLSGKGSAGSYLLMSRSSRWCNYSAPCSWSHLELLFQDEDNEFKRGSDGKRHPVQDLLVAPASCLQRVAHNARRSMEPRVEVKCHVSSRSNAAAAGEIYLEPERRHTGLRMSPPVFCIRQEGRCKKEVHLSASVGTDPWMTTISPGSNPPRMVPAKGTDCGDKRG